MIPISDRYSESSPLPPHSSSTTSAPEVGVGREDREERDGVGRTDGTAGTEGRSDGTAGADGRTEGTAGADGRTEGTREGRLPSSVLVYAKVSVAGQHYLVGMTGVGRTVPEDERDGATLAEVRTLERIGCAP